MKMFKRFAAAVLCIALAVSFTACHKKDEIAVTVKGKDDSVSFTSAMYMYALIEADMEARNKVDTNKQSDSSSAPATTTDYYSETIDGKDYVTYVKDLALVNLKKMAAYELKAKELEVSLTDSEKAAAEYTAKGYWESYGYSQSFEPNGVGYQTFLKSYETYQLGNSVFSKIYGEGGEKEVPAETITKAMTENYELADILTAEAEDDSERTTLKNKFQAYADRINAGTSFETIYCEYNNTKPTETEKVTDDSQPLDRYASVVGSDDTTYADDAFDTIKKTEIGKAFVDTSDEDHVRLIVRGDLQSDPYYVKNMKNSVLWLLKESDFESYIEELYGDYTLDINKYAINQFKVKKIVYPTTQY